MNTINITKTKRPIYTSQSQFATQDLRIMNDMNPSIQTFGTVLANTKQERRLLNHEKTLKIWDSRSDLYSQKCKRNSKS